MKMGYIIVYVSDVRAAVTFYEKAFGLKCRFMHESGQYAEMETGSTALAFAHEDFVAETCQNFRRNRLAENPAGIEIGLIVEDVKQSFDRAVASGATPYVHPLQKPWGQTVSYYVRDNNGALVELCSEMVS